MSQPDNDRDLFGSSLPPELTEHGEPVFAEPWQAQAFAMTLTLYQRGLFTWNEWAATLAAKLGERASRSVDQSGQYYFDDWLAALESLVSRRTEIDPQVLAELKERWAQAYRTTPHGERVTL